MASHGFAWLCMALHRIASHRIASLGIAMHRIGVATHGFASLDIAWLCIALHHFASHCIELHCIASHRIASHRIASHGFVSICTHGFALPSHSIALRGIALYRFRLHCIALHGFVLPYLSFSPSFYFTLLPSSSLSLSLSTQLSSRILYSTGLPLLLPTHFLLPSLSLSFTLFHSPSLSPLHPSSTNSLPRLRQTLSTPQRLSLEGIRKKFNLNDVEIKDLRKDKANFLVEANILKQRAAVFEVSVSKEAFLSSTKQCNATQCNAIQYSTIQRDVACSGMQCYAMQ
jgi:hypothetical protein